MINKIIDNIFASTFEKGFIIFGNFITSILVIRFLSRSDFGIMGIVSGYFAFVNIINISLEAIILRDHVIYSKNLNKIMYNFLIFNLLKSLVFIAIGLGLAVLFSNYYHYQSKNFSFAIAALTIVLILDSITAPLSIYASSQYKQNLVARLAFTRQVFSLMILSGLYFYPSIQYIFFKELVVALIMAPLWYRSAGKNFGILFSEVDFFRDIDFYFIKKSLFSYSLYTHYAGVVTNFIYKADTFFLSFFTGLQSVGNYNISLTSANMANNISAIMGYQNSVAISNLHEHPKINTVTNTFIRISFYIAVMTALIYIFFGRFYIILVTGEDNKEIYHYMLCIVFSLLLIKSLSGPLTAYINIKGSVKDMFKNVLIPLFIITTVSYYLSARFFGPLGMAYANILNALIWMALLLKEIHKYDYSFTGLLDFRNDILFVKNFLKNKFSLVNK